MILIRFSVIEYVKSARVAPGLAGLPIVAPVNTAKLMLTLRQRSGSGAGK